jgi:two-component system, NtrC family, sensor kinase
MRRRAKPAKAKVEAKAPVVRKARKSEDSKVRDLEKRLAESLEREKATGRAATEALEQQTATSDVLRVISSSPTDVQPVFDAIVESAVRLSGALFGSVYRFDGELIHMTAHHNYPTAALEFSQRSFPTSPTRQSFTGRAILERAVVHVADVAQDPERLLASDLADVVGFRSALSVPMLREGSPIGAITVWRSTVGQFSDKQIALLQTFADQAVIAIENVRLFKELGARNSQLTEALEQQTATGEILRVISRSPTDIQPAFEAIVQSASQLCDGVDCIAVRFDGDLVHLMARHNPKPGTLDSVAALFPRRPRREGTATDRAILARRIVHVADLMADSAYDQEAARTARLRGILSVPLMRGEQVLGAISVSRDTPGLFSDRQVALLQTFADQAVIAIENVRLFKELEGRNRELTDALARQTATSDVLHAISQAQTDAQPVFDTIVASATRLCEADLSGLYLFDGAIIHFAAQHGRTPEEIEAARQAFPQPVGRASVSARAILGATFVQVPDVREDPEMADALRALFRTVMAVPILRDGRAIGTITVARRVVRPFSDEQIALLQTFANQAIIAIENVGLFNELQARNREIEDKSRQLEVASQHKSEFLANMSHELRTPLNAIIGFSEVLSEKMFGELNEKQEEYSKDIHASGQHLLSLINDILDLSKIEAGRMELELTDFDLPTAIENALMLVRERAGRRSLTLHKSVDAGVGQIRADERKIRQVVLNLLSNAIKFTPEGGRIEVAAVAKDGSVEVSVRDTGVGIAPEDQEAVFQEFRQVGTAEKKAEGTGLGLTLCRKFVELHGGRIWVKSQLGQGSVFTFNIPAIE